MAIDRIEYKYPVAVEDLPRLRRAIAPYVELDRFTRAGAVNEYTVRSIYFDTFGLRDYYEKESGLLRRKKTRVRSYNEYSPGAQVFFEIKRKRDMSISKDRSPVPFKQLVELIEGGKGGIGEIAELAQADEVRRFLYHFYRFSLRPTTLVSYEREAFFCKFRSSLRLTFDKNLRGHPFPAVAELFNDDITPVLPGQCIFEVKFSGGIPPWLRLILRDFNLSRQAMSKYCICLEKLGVVEQRSRFSAVAAAR